MKIITFISLTLLMGCPDPNASSSGTETLQGATGNQVSAGTGNQETDPSAARLTCTKEDPECLEISGKMVYDGVAKGSVRVDVQKVREGSAPMLVHTLELQEGGEFSFYAPKKYGKIIVTAFIDEAGDGPSPKDPQGRENIDIQDENLTDLTINVKADNAPVTPKPPQDKPNPDQGNQNGSSSDNPASPDAEQKKPDGPPPDDAGSDGPPADE